MGVARPVIPAEVRFAQKYRVDEETGCWVWTASLTPTGYSNFNDGSGNRNGHRFAYEHFVGPIPDGLTVDHLCRNRACVNPAHLEAVSMRTNLLRGESVASKNSRKTHCSKGHPYDDENTYVNPNTGRRSCRACVKAATLAWRAENPDKHRAYQRESSRARYANDPGFRERRQEATREAQRKRRLDPAVREREKEYKRQLREDARKWRESQKSDE